MTESDPSTYSIEGLADRRIVVMATGALGASFLHSWLGWLSSTSPSTEIRVVLTPSALQFVGLGTIRGFGYEPLIDTWSDNEQRPVHVELGQWADGYLVHPATMHFVSRLSAGLCDSPAMLAIQGSLAPVVVAASAPPGFTRTPVWKQYCTALALRPNVELLPPMKGFSVSDPALEGLPPVLFPAAAQALSGALVSSVTTKAETA
ncbi:flavoprotein [Williamsia soli]|uniref:flavoprotein n=1 Tax=Williamsia soli TaxID=364929 RepID=UPI001A9F89A2|nr:flavoprotein [Williamsia soli]